MTVLTAGPGLWSIGGPHSVHAHGCRVSQDSVFRCFYANFKNRTCSWSGCYWMSHNRSRRHTQDASDQSTCLPKTQCPHIQAEVWKQQKEVSLESTVKVFARDELVKRTWA